MFYLNFAENASSRLTITDWLDLGSNVSGNVKSFQDRQRPEANSHFCNDNSLDQQRSAEQLTELTLEE
jgi:hypothetical protein